MRRYLLAALFLACSTSAWPAADEAVDAEIKRLQSVLGILNQELGAEYEQIKALQQALHSNAAYGPPRSPDVTSYDETAANQRKDLQRDASMRAHMDTVFQRIKDLEAQKQPILDRLRDLISSDRFSGTAVAPVAPR